MARRSRNPPTGRRGDSTISSSLFSHGPPMSTAHQQSQSSPDPADKYSATPSPILTEAGTSARLYFRSRSQLLLADESSGVTVRMKLFRDFNLLAAGRLWNSLFLASGVCRVRSMRQVTVLLMRGVAIRSSRCTRFKFVGLSQLEMIRQQS